MPTNARKILRRTGAWLSVIAILTPASRASSRLEHAESVRAGLGWRDNVMLSPFAPVARGFGRAELESFLSWQRGDWRVLSLLSGDVLRYLSPPPEVAGEQQWLLHAESRWEPRAGWRAALKADAFLQDLVVDLSETEAARTVLADRVRGAFATLAPRLPLPAGFALEPSVQRKRVDYRSLNSDYDETRTGARLAWRRGNGPGLALGWMGQQRDYADRTQYTARGRSITGTRLTLEVRELQFSADAAWRAAGEWNATLTLARGSSRDGASGFFDHDQRHARVDLTWRPAAWKLSLEADAKRADYRIQTVGTGLAPPPRVADTYSARLRAERRLNPRWLAYLEHGWERNRSNEREFSYRANTALAGVQHDF